MKIIYYFKWAFKQLKGFPVQSLINIGGLSIGLTVFALITLFVCHQKSVNTFHSNLDNIYRAENCFSGTTPATYMEFYKSQIPEIKNACRFGRTDKLLHYQPDNNPTEDLLKLAVAEHWQLTELTPQHHSLEDVFMNIIQQESSTMEQQR